MAIMVTYMIKPTNGMIQIVRIIKIEKKVKQQLFQQKKKKKTKEDNKM